MDTTGPLDGQIEVASYNALYAEIQAQLAAIDAHTQLLDWPYTTIGSSTTRIDWPSIASHLRGQGYIWTPGSQQTRKKPTRPKVRYHARWRKEAIERKLRKV